MVPRCPNGGDVFICLRRGHVTLERIFAAVRSRQGISTVPIFWDTSVNLAREEIGAKSTVAAPDLSQCKHTFRASEEGMMRPRVLIHDDAEERRIGGRLGRWVSKLHRGTLFRKLLALGLAVALLAATALFLERYAPDPVGRSIRNARRGTINAVGAMIGAVVEIIDKLLERPESS